MKFFNISSSACFCSNILRNVFILTWTFMMLLPVSFLLVPPTSINAFLTLGGRRGGGGCCTSTTTISKTTSSTRDIKTTTTTTTMKPIYYSHRTPLMGLYAAQEQPPKSKNSNSQKNKKQKPPRFTQQAHKGNNNSSKKKSSSVSSSSSKRQQRQAWESGKSIDELESTMMKRWGTLDNPMKKKQRNTILTGGSGSGSGSGGGIISEKNGINSSKKKSQKEKQQQQNRRRPVLDPWQKQEQKSQKNLKNNFVDDHDEWNIIEEDDDFGYDDDDVIIVDEYYDHDDEGYESPSTTATSNNNNNNKLSVGHLISPKPVGGKGTRQQQSKQQDADSSYFFNPNKQSLSSTTSKSTNNNMNDSVDDKTNYYDNEKSSSSSPPSKVSSEAKRTQRTIQPKQPPLLDKDGNEVLLTVDEAKRRFYERNNIGVGDDDDDERDDDGVDVYPEYFQGSSSSSTSSWEEVGIMDTTLRMNLEEYMACPNPLSVQEKSCPAILTGNDLLMGTYTGSGKTLAFLVPLIQQLLWSSSSPSSTLESDEGSSNVSNDGKLSILIVAPGRELASQIVSVARELLEDTPFRVQLAIGGTTFTRNLEQIRKRKPNILVGTPGRIAELVVGKPGEKRGRLNIANLNALVLDEVDALLEYKPHRDPTRAILQTCKRRHGDRLQTILCSATIMDIVDTAKEFLRPGYATAMADKDDILVASSSSSSREGEGEGSGSIIKTKVSRTVLHGVIRLPQKRGLAMETVRKILHTEPIPQQILIFVDSARKVDIIVEKLASRGILAAALHGGMGSDKMDRAEVAKALREGYVGIVVATELAARGIDAPYLTHVINMDLPTDSSHYAHRAGRCGRGGRPGVVINIATSHKEHNVPQRFAKALGVEMHDVEPRGGKLVMLEKSSNN